jgi:hypothetical protein
MEGKIVPLYAMKAYRRTGCIIPLFHNLGINGGELTEIEDSSFV